MTSGYNCLAVSNKNKQTNNNNNNNNLKKTNRSDKVEEQGSAQTNFTKKE